MRLRGTMVYMNTASTDRRINRFLEACASEGLTSPLKRSQIKAIRIKHNLPMPLWIVQDESRRLSHGLYEVPELTEYLKNMNLAAVPTSTVAAVVSVPSPSTGMELARRVETLEAEVENLVPKSISTYVPFGAYKDIERVIKMGRFFPVYITGLSGNGKTTMVQQICAKNGREFVRCNISKETDEDDLLGGFRLINGESVWVDGPAVVAMKRGAILLLDEVDLNPDKIMCLQPVMEGRDIFLKKINQYVSPKAGFNILATANTKGQGGEESVKFIGTMPMNEAFLERFGMTIEHEYPSRSVEKKIVLNIMEREECVDESFAENLVRWADTIRKTYYEGACDDIITTRRLEHIVVAFGIFRDRLDAVTKGTARFNRETKQSFIDLYTKIDGEVGVQTAGGEATAPTVLDPATVQPSNIIELNVSYDDRLQVKSRGAHWDANAKVWTISGTQYLTEPSFFAAYSPKVRTN